MKNSRYNLQVDGAILQGNVQVHSRVVVSYHFPQKEKKRKERMREGKKNIKPNRELHAKAFLLCMS